MGYVRNVSGENRFPADLNDRLVVDGQVIEVPDESVFGYTCQDAWEAADEPTAALAAEQQAANAEANPVTPVEPDPEPAEPTAPAGNAKRDEWFAWALLAGRASIAQLTDLGRDEIRDTFGPHASTSTDTEPPALDPNPEAPKPPATDPADDEPADTDNSGDEPQEV